METSGGYYESGGFGSIGMYIFRLVTSPTRLVSSLCGLIATLFGVLLVVMVVSKLTSPMLSMWSFGSGCGSWLIAVFEVIFGDAITSENASKVVKEGISGL